MTRPPAMPSAPIGVVERETGLSKDTLRMWERRYGFPVPVRDTKGERVYPADQVERLRLIKRLLDTGARPNKVVGVPLSALNAQLARVGSGEPGPEDSALNEVVQLLKAHDPGAVQLWLTLGLMRLGLLRFVMEMVAPLTTLVGSAWARGEIAIFEEHQFSEQVQHVLRQAIGNVPESGQRPRVLLTTLSSEEHQLGLLMAHACIAVEGAQGIALGPRLPAQEIVDAARAHRADIVGLSFSTATQVHAASAALLDLRARLDPQVVLWAGGGIWQRTRRTIAGVRTIATLEEIPAALAEWRHAVQTQARAVSDGLPTAKPRRRRPSAL